MKKLLLVSSVLALASAPAFAANFNLSTVTQWGFGNGVGVAQGGVYNTNIQSTLQKGWGNTAVTTQGGLLNRNVSRTFQFGGNNTSIVLQH